jgi:hypothetical protein
VLCLPLFAEALEPSVGEVVFVKGEASSEATGARAPVRPFSEVQLDIYRRGGLLNK